MARARRARQRLGEDGLGAITGTAFAVWAPNARGVRVIGDFNHWDGRAHPMRSLGGTGIWELFVPEVGEGTRYKYDDLRAGRHVAAKADPMANLAERPPATASVVVHVAATSGRTAPGWRPGRAAAGP